MNVKNLFARRRSPMVQSIGGMPVPRKSLRARAVDAGAAVRKACVCAASETGNLFGALVSLGGKSSTPVSKTGSKALSVIADLRAVAGELTGANVPWYSKPAGKAILYTAGGVALIGGAVVLVKKLGR